MTVDGNVSVKATGAGAIGIEAGNVNIGCVTYVEATGTGINASNNITFGGDTTVKSNVKIGIFSYGGKIILDGGALDATATRYALFASSAIEYPSTHGVTMPDGGVVGAGSVTFYEGTAYERTYNGYTVNSIGGGPATHAVIKRTAPCIVTFNTNGHGGGNFIQTVEVGQTALEPAALSEAAGHSTAGMPIAPFPLCLAFPRPLPQM